MVLSIRKRVIVVSALTIAILPAAVWAKGPTTTIIVKSPNLSRAVEITDVVGRGSAVPIDFRLSFLGREPVLPILLDLRA